MFRLKPTKVRLVATVLLGLMLIPLGSIFAATSYVVVSGPSPYANCTAGIGPGAAVYTNAEVEPSVAVNPANPKNLIGAWQQDRWNDGGSHGLVAGYSFDGGKTWGTTALPFS